MKRRSVRASGWVASARHLGEEKYLAAQMPKRGYQA